MTSHSSGGLSDELMNTIHSFPVLEMKYVFALVGFIRLIPYSPPKGFGFS